jgi:glycosyltransferase involved in cell wall biosynthesis
MAGPDSQLMQLTRALTERGLRVTIFVPEDEAHLAAVSETPSGKIVRVRHRNPLPKWLPISPYLAFLVDVYVLSRQLAKLVRPASFDVVQVFHPITATVCSQSLDLPIVYYDVMGDTDWTAVQSVYRRLVYLGLQSSMNRLAVRKSAAIVALSKLAARALQGLSDRWSPASGIQFGVDTVRFTPDKRNPKVRATYGLGGAFTILYVGRVEPLKGADLLIEALSMILQRKPDTKIKLLMVGKIGNPWTGNPTDYFKKLTESIARRNLNEVVRFLGVLPQGELSVLMSNADLLVLPSRLEAMGNVLLEALASGIPIIGSRVGGIPEVVEESQAGLLFDANDPEDLARQIESMMDPSVYDSLKAVARRAATERFSWNIAAERLLDVYQGVVRSKRQKSANSERLSYQ